MISIDRPYAYAVGEDVVVRLEDVEVYDLQHMSLIPAIYIPKWTIARIRSFVAGNVLPAYMFRSRMCGRACIWVAEESAIEGVA